MEPAALAGFESTQVIQEISRSLRASYIVQSAITLERQLPANATLAVTYTNSHRMHEFRSQDINAPLPGAYNPSVQDSGVFPLGRPGPVELMESSGIYNQNQLISNVSAKGQLRPHAVRLLCLQSRVRQYGWHRNFPRQPLQLRGRIRSGGHRCASSRDRRRLHQSEVGCAD